MIRKLKEEDILTCVEIYKLTYEDDNTDKWTKMVVEDLSAMFTSKGIIPQYFIIEEDNEIVGFAGYCNCGFDLNVFGLTWCTIHPQYRNKGYGKLLVEERLKYIKKEGGKKVFSSQREEVTWHLERFGFERLEENGEYEGDKYYLMRLNLNNETSILL